MAKANTITKKNVLMALQAVNFTEDINVDGVVVTPEHISEFLEKSIAQLDNKAAKAAEKAAATRAAGDELKTRIKDVLGETPMTVVQIVEALDDPEVTNAKVIARASQLVKAGEIFKSDVKTEDNRKLVGYSTVAVDAE